MTDKIEIKTIKVVTIDGEDYPVIHEIPILWQGLELDDVGYIIQYDGENRLVLSDHGEFKLISNIAPEPIVDLPTDPMDVSILTNRIKSYKNAIENTKQGIKLLME